MKCWCFLSFMLLGMMLLPSFIVPTSAQQTLLVQKTWGGSSDDSANSVAVDSYGNIYVTGESYSFGPGSPTYSALTLLKYDPGGHLLWQRLWSGVGNASDVGLGVTVDVAGNIYVTGWTQSFGTYGPYVLVLKFDSFGNLLWQKTWGGGTGGGDAGQAVAVDSSGAVYVTGDTASFGAGGNDIFLLKLDSSGDLLWQKTWGGSSADLGYGVAIDSLGAIYITGWTSSFSANDDIFLLKLDSSGNLLWQKTWGAYYTPDEGFGVALDSSGDAYVTGYTNPSAGHHYVALLKFNATGSLLWQRTWGGENDYGQAIAVDGSGNAYVTGHTGNNTSESAFILKVSSSGNLLYHLTWGPHSAGTGVALDSLGNIVVVGGVSQPAPYAFGSSGNDTLGNPVFALGSPNFVSGTPSFPLNNPAGMVKTPSGNQFYAGATDEFMIKYGLLPTLTFLTSPTGGRITFNSTLYTNGQSANYSYGNATISASSPAGYIFSSWITTGGVTVDNAKTNLTTANIKGPGILTANFTRAKPLTPMEVLSAGLTAASVLLLRRQRRPSSLT